MTASALCDKLLREIRTFFVEFVLISVYPILGILFPAFRDKTDTACNFPFFKYHVAVFPGDWVFAVVPAAYVFKYRVGEVVSETEVLLTFFEVNLAILFHLNFSFRPAIVSTGRSFLGVRPGGRFGLCEFDVTAAKESAEYLNPPIMTVPLYAILAEREGSVLGAGANRVAYQFDVFFKALRIEPFDSGVEVGESHCVVMVCVLRPRPFRFRLCDVSGGSERRCYFLKLVEPHGQRCICHFQNLHFNLDNICFAFVVLDNSYYPSKRSPLSVITI